MQPQTLTVADHLALTYRPDLEVLIARWRRPVSLSELQAGYYALADEAERCGTVRWLLDTRALTISIEAGQWVNDSFFPTLATRFHQPLRMAYMVPPDSQRRLQTDAEMASLLSRFEKAMFSYCFKLFDQEGDAQRWLAAPTPH
ncbi:hypothetical protein MTX78_19140 [Hymenobacter tibetensis]|uniref:STAS/SEC14 domain-containing protein n=1 Tax=Hymenobacter tibetensis TaxID=497967 RepID=A0ABY4CVC8_9BACT|nr:hypothetical protein [Hymenobacter tibetensis]UOG74224.1 hypothetical protein MTX78_19140 [Hymenobacter tibetensis]